MTRLSIVIVSYNSRGELGALLQSLTTPAPTVAHEIVVVDNASTDATPSMLRQQWPQVTVIESATNVGFARANNRGVRATNGDLLLLLNPDTIVPAGAIDGLVASVLDRADVAVAGPRIVDGDGHAELSFGAMIAPWTELRQKLLVTGSDRGLAPFRRAVERLTRETKTVDWVSGACLLIRRADFDAVGGLDERYFMYAEDVDLCASVRARGRSVLFVADVQIVHLRGRSAASAARATRDAYQRSHLAFYAKHHPRWLPALKAYLKIRGELPDTRS